MKRPLSILALGVAAGIVSGLTGVGGGIIMVPALVLLYRFQQHRAHGTSLTIMVFTALAGAIQYAWHGEVNARLAVQFAVGGVVGAAVGAWLASLVRGRTLRRLFGVLLFLLAGRLVYATWVGGSVGAMVPWMHGVTGLFVESGVGLAAGVVGGFFGVGGGIVVVPAIVLLLGESQKLAQGVSLCVIVPVSLSGAIAHHRQGNADLGTAAFLVPATVLGNLAGARIATGPATDQVLATIFSALLAATGYLMLARR
jgi:uncharacterized membrane protein YfcA